MDYLQKLFIKKTQLHFYHHYILLMMMMMMILLNIELSYQLDDTTICPKQCICSSKRMNCELSGLNYLPIPPPILQLEYLLIQNQTFMNTELGPNELSIYRSIEYGGQIQLKSLHIRYCNIISLKRNTFQILGKQLRLLDLTGNPLIHIEDYTFNGLDQLTLIMDEIKLRNFQLNTFNGLTHMKSLIIRNSNLYELPYQSLIQLITMSKLNQLIINGNQLKQLDKKYDVIFKELQHFEINDNPWHCDCQLNWLIKRYQSIHKSHRNNTIENNNNNNNNNNKWNHNDEEDDNQPKCSTPFSLAGYKFNDLITDLSEVYDYNNPMTNTWEKSNSPFILYCTPPQLERLDVDLTHLYQMENSMIKKTDHQQYPSVRLTCSMKGSRELSITWYYHNNNNMTLVNLSNHHITHRYPNNKQISYTNNDIIKVESQLDIIKQQQIDRYSCIGIDIISNVTATIQLQWPLLKIDNQLSLSAYNESKSNYLNNWSTNTTTTTSSSSSTATTISSLSYTNSMLHIKQFSLGELIAATAGTFLSTVLLFFIIYQTFHCRLTSCDQRKLYRPHKTDHSSILEVPNLSPDGGGISSLNTLCNISRPNTITTTTTTTSTTSTTTITTTTTNNSNNSSSNSSVETNLLQNSITNCPINQLNSESISLTTNLLNTQQFLNGLSGFNHGTLPVNIRQQTIQTELGRCIQPTSNSTIGDGSLNSMSYEPISYSDTNNVTYDVPWIVNTNTNDHNINHHKLMNMNQRITNEQCIPLLYNGLSTNLSNPIESNSNNLIHNGLFIPPPPSIPQPSLPNSCTNSTLSLKTVTIQPNIQSNLLFLQSGCYPQLMNSVTTNSQFNQGSIGLTNYLNYHS